MHCQRTLDYTLVSFVDCKGVLLDLSTCTSTYGVEFVAAATASFSLRSFYVSSSRVIVASGRQRHASIQATRSDSSQLLSSMNVLHHECASQVCNEWRMGVNGSKTELVALNLESNICVLILNNKDCAIAKFTKLLGLLIDDKLSYKDHLERVSNKAKRNWDNASRVLVCKWGFAIPALVLLYKKIIDTHLVYPSAIWCEKKQAGNGKSRRHI